MAGSPCAEKSHSVGMTLPFDARKNRSIGTSMSKGAARPSSHKGGFGQNAIELGIRQKHRASPLASGIIAPRSATISAAC